MRKKFNRILCSLLVILTVFLISVPIAVFGASDSEETEVVLLQAGNYSALAADDAGSTTSSGGNILPSRPYEEASNYIYEKLLSCTKSFNLFSYRVHVDDFRNMYCNVINDNPDLFYVSSTVDYSFYTASGYVSSIRPRYTMSQSLISAHKKVFDKGAAEALSKVDDSMTDLQKALVLHDYICDLATFPADALTNDKNIYHSAYGFFYDKNIVCAGYALTYSYLLHQLGIECEYVVSTQMQHAWNSVKIDGKWYNVDLCFDDMSCYNNNMNVRGGMLHRCFMKSNAYMESERGFYHYGPSTYDNCDMVNTEYDDYFWDDVNTNICVLDGDYYYLDVNPNEKSDVLIKRSVDGTESQVGTQKFEYATVTSSTDYTDAQGVKHSVEIKDPLCRLVYLDNRFYITYGKYLVSYALIDGSYNMYVIYKDDNYNLMGIGSDKKGNLQFQRRTDYETVTLVKDEYFKNHITTHGESMEYNNYADINLDGIINAKDYVYISSE